jgi:hypothetical protein
MYLGLPKVAYRKGLNTKNYLAKKHGNQSWYKFKEYFLKGVGLPLLLIQDWSV